MGEPSPAETLLRIEQHESLVRTVLLQMIGAIDAGNPGTNDQHIEVLYRLRSGSINLGRNVHILNARSNPWTTRRGSLSVWPEKS